MSEDEKKEKIRAAFPQCIAFADVVREVFGPDVKLIYMQEGGRGLGDPGDPSDAEHTVTLAHMSGRIGRTSE